MIPFDLTAASLGLQIIIYIFFVFKSECVSGIVQGAGPNVEAGRIRAAGLSLGTAALEGQRGLFIYLFLGRR